MTTLLDDYNYYRLHTGHVAAMRERGAPVRFLQATADREQALGKMEAWCRERDLDPTLWLYSLFERSHWRWPPRFDQLTPSRRTEKKQIERYRSLGEVPLIRRRNMERRHADAVDRAEDYDPNRDLSTSVEALKRFYLDALDPSGCLEDRARTLGYHPRSLCCARCPISADCARALSAAVSFDIAALRRGEITSAQARAQAARRGP